MGVTLVVVRHLLPQAIAFISFTESFHSPNRMVTFSVGLLLLCFVISNLWTRSFVALTSFPVLTFILWCLWICLDSSSNGGTVPARLKFLYDFAESLRICPAFPVRHTSDDGNSRHSPSSSRGDVSNA